MTSSPQAERLVAATRARLRIAGRWLPTAAVLLPLVVLVAMPVAMLVYASFVEAPPRAGVALQPLYLENYRRLLTGQSAGAVRNSIVLGIGGTFLALTFGGSLAWLAARTDVPGRVLVQLAGVMSLFMSALVGALAWSLLASPRRGLLNIVLADLGINWNVNIYSLPGMTLVFGLYYAPYAFLFIYSALTLVNPDIEEAARVHGATAARATIGTTFPLLAPAILGAATLTFVLITENFAVPQVLGTPGGIATLPSYMYRLMSLAPAQANEAAAVGVVLTALVAGAILVQRRIITARDYTTVTGKGFEPRRISLGRWRWPALMLAMGYLVVGVVLPFGALFQMALRRGGFIADTAAMFDLDSMTGANFASVIGSGAFTLSLSNSLKVSLASGLVGVIFCIVMSYLVYRTSVPGRVVVEYVAMAPLAIPALVIGMGFLWTWYALPIPLYGTLTILVLAYVARFMPQGFRSITSSIMQVHRDLEEAAMVSGASQLRATRAVVLPLIRSGVVGTFLLLLILAMRELSASLFLFTGRTRVLSIYLFDLYDGGGLGRAAAASLLYSGLLLVMVLLARRWMNVQGPGRGGKPQRKELEQ